LIDLVYDFIDDELTIFNHFRLLSQTDYKNKNKDKKLFLFEIVSSH